MSIRVSRPPSLLEESRSAVRARIVRAARGLLATEGFSMRIEDVAEAAGISRRTVFRYFRTHGELIVAAASSLWADLQPTAPELAPGTDLEAWLIDHVTRTHRMMREEVGVAWWDLHAPVPQPNEQVAAWIQQWRDSRDQSSRVFTDTVWSAAGGSGAAPGWVHRAFALALSMFAAHGMAVNRELSAEETGTSSGRIMWSVLAAALADAANQPAVTNRSS